VRGIIVVDPGAVPGASTIDPRGSFQGGETGSTRVVKTHLLPGIVPPLSG
jgi:hypothetical protein